MRRGDGPREGTVCAGERIQDDESFELVGVSQTVGDGDGATEVMADQSGFRDRKGLEKRFQKARVAGAVAGAPVGRSGSPYELPVDSRIDLAAPSIPPARIEIQSQTMHALPSRSA